MLHQTVKNAQPGFPIFEPAVAPSLPDIVVPGYLHLLDTGELYSRVSEAYQHLESCDLCPHRCGVNRRMGELGICRTGANARLSSSGPHMGEEDVLSGERGSGTVFFAGCTLHCQYCQNHSISQTSAGKEVSAEELAAILLDLQNYGCHNINFVTPDHVVPQILAAVLVAAKKGLHIPLVWNSGGYDSTDTLRLLDGIIDIYLPDMKYSSDQAARRYSKAGDYPQINHEAVREMHRQVGDLILDETGQALRGLLVRHLVLPHNMAGTEEIMRFLAEEISPNTYVNIMPQYRPAFQAHLYASLNRPVFAQEYEQALQLARQAGLTRLHGVG